MSTTEQNIYDRIHWPADTYADGVDFTKRFLGDDGTDIDPEIGDGSMVYDHSKRRAETFMVSGNGPSGWVWFIFTEEGEIDHAYMQYSDGHTALLPIPFHLEQRLLDALRLDVEKGINR